MHRYQEESFLQITAAGTCGSVVHNVLTPGFAAKALAAPTHRAFSNNPIVIVCNLAGGASYQLAPIYYSAWRDKNPTVSYGPDESFAISGAQGIHPSLELFNELYEAGDLLLANKLGFENHSRSHSEAARMWMTGHSNPESKPGMLNQLSCQMNGLFSAISLAGDDPIFAGSCPGARKLEGLATLNGTLFKRSEDQSIWIDKTRESVMALDTNPVTPTRRFVKTAMQNMDGAAETIRELSETDLPEIDSEFPGGGFGNDCRDAAQIIQASSATGTRAIYLEQGGFDTHSNERNSMPGNLTRVNDGLRALVETIKALGRWDDVTIVVLSEFARTFENGSQGTDHGGPGPAYLMGGKVNGGRIISPTPSNSEIASANGFLRGASIDTRNFYSQIVSGMGYDGSQIFTESFDRTDLGLFA